MQSPKPQVFISYGRRDAGPFAKRLADWLRAEGYEPWLDVENGIPAGAPFDVRLEVGISASSVIVALLTPWSVNPEGFCRNEWLFAQWKRIPILPVRLDLVVPPIQIISLNFIEALGDPESALDPLRAALADITSGRPNSPWSAPRAEELPAWIPAAEPLSVRDDLLRHGGAFHGREWLFEQMQRWVDEPNSRVLALVGPVGIGKSAIIAQLSARLEVRGLHFCSRSLAHSCLPVPWILGLVRQLAAQYPEYRRALSALGPPSWSVPEAAFRSLVTDLLTSCGVAASTAPPAVFAVDGLDEAIAAGGVDLVDLLSGIADYMPGCMRLIVSTRPDSGVLARFDRRGVAKLSLESRDARNVEDVREYVEGRLMGASVGGVPDPDRRRVASQLVQASAGHFLYARTVLDGLPQDSSVGSGEARPEGGFPEHLGGLYHAMFRGRFASEREYQQGVRPLLDCLVAARGPLSEALLTEASGLSPEAALAGVRHLSQFLFRGPAGLTLGHASLRDWLSDSQGSAPYTAVAAQGHLGLVRASRLGLDRSLGDSAFRYARAHVAVHLAAAGAWEDLAQELGRGRLDLPARWTDGGEVEDGLTCLPGLIQHLSGGGAGDRNLAAGLATQLARIHTQRGEHSLAETWLSYALARARGLGGRRVRAIALHELGSLRLYRGDLDAAGRAYRRALRVCRLSGPTLRDERAANLLALAIVDGGRLRFERAGRRARRALDLASRAQDDSHVAACHRFLATHFKDSLLFEESAEHLAAAWGQAELSGLVTEGPALRLVQAWSEYAQSALVGHPPHAAARHFADALEDATRVQRWFHSQEARQGLAWCALVSGDPVEGGRWVAEMRAHAPRVGDGHVDLALALELAAAALLHLCGEFQDAGEAYRMVALSSAARGQKRFEADARVGSGALLWHAKAYVEAEAEWARARALAKRCTVLRRRLVDRGIERSKLEALSPPL